MAAGVFQRLTCLASFVWGGLADKIGRCWAMIIPAILGFIVTPFYLLTTDYTTIAIAFSIQGLFAGAIYGQNPSYADERFQTEIRATAAAFCYHFCSVVAPFLTPILTYFAVDMGMGFAIPMFVSTSLAPVSFVIALLLGPETKGNALAADLEIIAVAESP